MDFLHHTREALDEYVSLAEPDLETSLQAMGCAAESIVAECVGLSLTLLEQDLTFALVAPSLPGATREPAFSHRQAAAAAPSQASDPAPTAGPDDGGQRAGSGLDEDLWALMARSQSAEGIASSLSLPMLEDGRVVGGITLYASSEDAFAGRHTLLADALGASADGAVTNADLGFEARRRAEEAPRRLREEQIVDVGTGILAARLNLDIGSARGRLREASAHAGVTEAQAAAVILAAHRG